MLQKVKNNDIKLTLTWSETDSGGRMKAPWNRETEIYRDFKNKLQKVDGDFRPFRSSEMHEILCLVIIRVGFLKMENKNLVIKVVEE